MRNQSIYCIIFLFLILGYTLSSCGVAKKRKDKRIIGVWNVVNVAEQNPTMTVQWVFDPDGIIYVLNNSDSMSVVVDEGIWTITQKVNAAFLNTAFGSIVAQQGGLNVLWELLSLQKTTMYITHQDGGLLTMEFERAN
ncbi:MAG: hypothetical protein JKX73_09100 [Flavobacteriales bacterium]|nr:hypothetical protein [Flavobacteriales bacterium]